MKTIKEQLADWLYHQMNRRELKNLDVVEAYRKTGKSITPAYVSNMRNIGMSLRKAQEVASIMGWAEPRVIDGVVIEGNKEEQEAYYQNLISGLNKDTSNETHVIISSPTTQVEDNKILDKIQVSKPWLQATYPHLINLSELALCEIKGDSMEPTFKEKDTILVDTEAQTVAIDGIYVFTYHDTLLIKRIQRIPGKGYSVISDNKEIYVPFSIPNEDLEHLTVHGRVIGKFGFNKI